VKLPAALEAPAIPPERPRTAHADATAPPSYPRGCDEMSTRVIVSRLLLIGLGTGSLLGSWLLAWVLPAPRSCMSVRVAAVRSPGGEG
jgi:hypothetical protein